MNSSARGVDKFWEGYNCAQAVLFSLAGHTGLSEELSLIAFSALLRRIRQSAAASCISSVIRIVEGIIEDKSQ